MKRKHKCKWYSLLEGYTEAEHPASCRGCKFNLVPWGCDGGCSRPQDTGAQQQQGKPGDSSFTGNSGK